MSWNDHWSAECSVTKRQEQPAYHAIKTRTLSIQHGRVSSYGRSILGGLDAHKISRSRCPPPILFFFSFLKFEHQETDTAAAINTVVMSSPLASPASTAVTPALIIPSLRRVPVPGPAPLVPADFPDDDKLKIFPGELTLDEILPRGTIRPFSGDDDSGSSKKPRL